MLSPIEDLSEKVRNLDREIQALWNKVRSLELPKINGMEFKSLVLDEFSCTAALEVQLEKLATYFDRRARENAKRAEKLEGKLTTFTDLVDIVKSERGAYYFSGKEDSYKNAARKVRELLAPPAPEVNTWTWKYWKEPEPEVWVIELDLGLQRGWVRACNSGVKGEFSSVAEANSAIKSNVLPASWYRVVRK